ncbi:MAG: DUF58 domain-containing protein [Planctomycetes bacterium]|nr:DUF58 domain-containing protein [Planctomycetota bacterium]
MAVAFVCGWTSSRFTFQFSPDRRGIYPIDKVFIESRFPFGLFRARREILVENELIVWPRSVAVDVVPDSAEVRYKEDRTSDRRAGDIGDIMGTRQFRQGDSLRRVHWGQSARQGALIVNERQVPTTCSIRLVLDVDSNHHSIVGSENSLEHLLRVGASLLESLHRQHAQVECVIGGDIFVIDSSATGLRRCLDAISRLPVAGTSQVGGKTGGCSHRSFAFHSMSFLITTERGHSAWSTSGRSLSRVVSIVLNDSLGEVDCNEARHGNLSRLSRFEIPISATSDALEALPQLWRRVCYAI